MTTTPNRNLPDWARPGQVIIEKQRERWAAPRRINGVYGSLVAVESVTSGRRTYIRARNLYRYRPVER